MYVRCEKCGYDSGDRQNNDELAAKVAADGGQMEMTHDDLGKPAGLRIVCPAGHDGDEVRID